jgi:DNA-binding transcriptional LysR family regulator
LFDRSGSRLQPTKEGIAFYDEAARALGSVAYLAQAAEKIRKGTLGRLAIASYPSASISLLPTILADFIKARPSVSIQLTSRNSERRWCRLRREHRRGFVLQESLKTANVSSDP